MVVILSKSTVLYLSYFVIYSLKLELILFYNNHYHTRIFLILLLHPIVLMICLHTNGFKYFYLIQNILLTINHLFALS